MVQLACEFLAREGCSPRLLVDGAPRFSEILFRYDGGFFVAGVDERDRDFLDVSCAELLDPPPDEVTALRLANAVQGTHKVVKIGVGQDPRLLFFHAPVLLRGSRRPGRSWSGAPACSGKPPPTSATSSGERPRRRRERR